MTEVSVGSVNWRTRLYPVCIQVPQLPLQSKRGSKQGYAACRSTAKVYQTCLFKAGELLSLQLVSGSTLLAEVTRNDSIRSHQCDIQ